MIMKANKQIGFIYKNNESIDKILKDGDVVFERGFLREKTSTTLPITFGGVGKALKDYKTYGNTVQNNTTGKNLFKASSSNYPQGLTITYNSDTGEISFSGTTTGGYPTLSNFTGTNVPPGEYTFSIDKPLPYAIGCRFRNSNGQYPTVVTIPSGELSRTVTVSYNAVRLELVYSASTSGIQVPQTTIKPMIESGTTATEFEPYTGGQPSPNPDYPQEIISCGDRTKNLFIVPQTIPNAQRNLATYTKINDNSFSLNYTQTNSTFRSPFVRIDFDVTKFKPNTQYTVSKKHIVEGLNFNRNGSIRTYINGVNGSVANTNSITFTTPNEIASLGIYFYSGYENTTKGESTITFYDIQLEEGTATEFEPYYDGYKIPVNVRSDNLFDKDNFIEGYIDSSGVYHTDSSIKANALSDYIKIDNNTDYIFSAKNNIYGLNFALYDSNKVFIKRVTSNNTSYNQINSETANYCRVWCNISQQTNITSELIEQYEIQLIKSSSKPSKYIPYYNETTNIYLDEPLRKIGEYSDYIDFINGKVVRNIEEIVLNGTENNPNINTSQTNTVRLLYSNLLVNNKSIANNPNVISNYLIGKIMWAEDSQGIYTNTNDMVIRINKSIIGTTINEINAWITEHNIEACYPLSTPTEEDIELPNIPTVDGNNTLNIETEITPSQVYIKYKSNE